ncbi:hypothetical protein V491_04647, partial [Pseudogymnoascus sp. VKM F-3775]
AQNEFDILGGVLYIAVIILELGILGSHWVWLLRTLRIRRAAVLEGKTFDDVLEEKARAGEAWDFAERRFRPKRAKKGGKGGEDVEMQAEGGSVDTSTVPTSTAASSIDKNAVAVAPDFDGSIFD